MATFYFMTLFSMSSTSLKVTRADTAMLCPACDIYYFADEEWDNSIAKKSSNKKQNKTDFAGGFVVFVNYTASYKRVALEIMLL